MSNLITAYEAFDALLNGFTVLCRPAGDTLDFAELEQFPATVFVMPNYEFCVKLELIELSGIQFAKPLTLENVKLDQDIYLIEPTGSIYWYKYNEVPALKTAIANGFAQADVENARLQLKAYCAAVGRDVDTSEARIVPIGGADKQKAPKKKSSKSTTLKQVVVTQTEDLPKTSANALDSAIVITEQSYVSSSEDFLVQPATESDVKPDANAQFEILLDAVRICNSEKELDSTCANLDKEGFTPEQIKFIDEAKQNRLTELDAQEIDAATIEMPANYKSLKQSICDATTPDAVNAVMNYTGKWSEEQRNALLLEMHKKLAELDKGGKQENEPPYLLEKIQSAPDFESLDVLVIEVSKRDEFIQPKLMGAVKKRRFELKTFKAAIPEKAEPEYLLGADG